MEILFALLSAMRSFLSFVLAHMSGVAPGESTIFLNVRVGNREAAIKQQVGDHAKESLAGNKLLGRLAPAFGGLMGNLAAAAITDEDLTRQVGTALVNAMQDSNRPGASDTSLTRTSANICFLQGEVTVVRVHVSCSTETVCELLARAIGPRTANRYRSCLSVLRRLRLPAASNFIDDALRSLVASQITRSFGLSASDMGDQLASSSGALTIVVQPMAVEHEAEFLFKALQSAARRESVEEERWRGMHARWKAVEARTSKLRALYAEEDEQSDEDCSGGSTTELASTATLANDKRSTSASDVAAVFNHAAPDRS